MMSPRERVLAALRGGHADRVPFTVYECMMPQCAAEREMRRRGLCIVQRNFSVFKVHRPNVRTTRHVYWEGERKFVRTTWETPAGTLTALEQAATFTSWALECPFKTPDDFKALLFLIQDERYEPTYAEFARAERAFGEDAIFRAQIGLEPMQMLVSGGLLGMEDFGIQWMDHRDEMMKLYHAVAENRRKLYPIVAASPALHANYGGNVVPEVIGLENFEKYYVPHYNEAAEVMHRHGKLIGCHFDADCRMLSKAIAGTGLDYVEAFTPSPTTDMTLGEARQAWPDKTLWLNFPSQVHLASDAEVERTTVEMLNELSSVDGVIMGITEDMPEDRWQGSCRAIMDGLERHAREHPGLYG